MVIYSPSAIWRYRSSGGLTLPRRNPQETHDEHNARMAAVIAQFREKPIPERTHFLRIQRARRMMDRQLLYQRNFRPVNKDVEHWMTDVYDIWEKYQYFSVGETVVGLIGGDPSGVLAGTIKSITAAGPQVINLELSLEHPYEYCDCHFITVQL
ncbi:hypothetical protein PLICRDRAFT_180378 [Plicaturopsis crispa FD-325 SS-3]|uniref:Uncharacterized protein n=1 Tax=Plicaturopsis crispa FD-325 SS-3 TaxID=944288 RepID=A0A0C9T2H5_PLICR|nr:hypothetical protein PLICRDRAFT_180378 [Plicaturopsis crispa FD-325 SS-3]